MSASFRTRKEGGGKYLCSRSQRIGVLLRNFSKVLEQLQARSLRSIRVLGILARGKLREKLLHLPEHVLVLGADLALLLLEQVAQLVAFRADFARQSLRCFRLGLQVVDPLRKRVPFRAVLVNFGRVAFLDLFEDLGLFFVDEGN